MSTGKNLTFLKSKISIPFQERRRLKERFPSLALAASDGEACRATLRNYESLALAREVCEGKCAMGRPCPTGLCRQPSKRLEASEILKIIL